MSRGPRCLTGPGGASCCCDRLRGFPSTDGHTLDERKVMVFYMKKKKQLSEEGYGLLYEEGTIEFFFN